MCADGMGIRARVNDPCLYAVGPSNSLSPVKTP